MSSGTLNYQIRAHMSQLAHIDTNLAPADGKNDPLQATNTNFEDGAPPSPRTGAAEPNRFWSPATSPLDDSREDSFTRFKTGIRISLKGPSPALEQDSEEFKRQAREIKRDLRRLSKCAEINARRKSKSPTRFEQEIRQLEHESEFRRRLSVEDGREFLLDFLRHHFADHVDKVTIKSTRTIEEIKMIGNEGRGTGVRACRRLFNAPVISDQIGLLLWQELRQGDALDHSHELRTDDEAERDSVAPEAVRRRRAEELEARMAEYMALKQSPVCNGALGMHDMQNYSCGCPEDVAPKVATVASTIAAAAAETEAVSTNYDVAEANPRVAEMVATEAAAENIFAAAAELSVPMDKRMVDGFLEGVKKRTIKGAEYFAASLATGYA
ncbi:hypothetical protein JX266_007600 [Neoarthrinium moseri]|nr:hypothetical protein JX266_007600 [Neoarthrinium moseri]